jgi:Spy/CpxP family protein refolding chaperone
MEISTNKFRTLVVLVVVLLTLNVATVVSLVYHTRQEKKEIFGVTDPNRSEAVADQGTRFFGQQLGLDPGQTEQFREINREYNRTINGIAYDLEKLRREMVEEMAAKITDKDKLQAISREIGVRHEEMKNKTIDYYLKMKSVCTEEQQEKLHTLFQKRVQKDEPTGSSPGRGNGWRWRGGRNQP